MQHMVQIVALMQHATAALAKEKQQWKIAFMGIISVLETSYLIATPYLGEQIHRSRVWIAPGGDLTKIQELHASKAEVMRDGGSVYIETEYGNFTFPSKNSENKRFSYGSGEVLRIYEYIVLN